MSEENKNVADALNDIFEDDPAKKERDKEIAKYEKKRQKAIDKEQKKVAKKAAKEAKEAEKKIRRSPPGPGTKQSLRVRLMQRRRQQINRKKHLRRRHRKKLQEQLNLRAQIKLQKRLIQTLLKKCTMRMENLTRRL